MFHCLFCFVILTTPSSMGKLLYLVSQIKSTSGLWNPGFRIRSLPRLLSQSVYVPTSSHSELPFDIFDVLVLVREVPVSVATSFTFELPCNRVDAASAALLQHVHSIHVKPFWKGISCIFSIMIRIHTSKLVSYLQYQSGNIFLIYYAY